MLLRISLIVAIVAGLAAAGLNFWKVQEVINTTMTERNNERDEKVKAQTELASTKTTLKKTEGELASTKKTLASTEASLKKETARANEQEKQAKDLSSRLAKTEGERDTAQRELVSWQATGLKPEQIKGLIADDKKQKEEKEIAMQENQIIAKQLKKTKDELARLIGTEDRPPAMPGVKGKIVAVDPKYDFVVLDIGGNQGVLERGELLVNRNGKLVAKIKVFSVEQNRSIANILPEWRGDVMEGDQVLY